jgi:hypothetical protein
VVHPDETENVIALETRVLPNSPENAIRFVESRKKEIDGLLESNVFGVMKRADATACGDRIYKSRFVDAVKNADSSRALDNSRFVISGFNDKEAKARLPRLRQCRRTQSE